MIRARSALYLLPLIAACSSQRFDASVESIQGGTLDTTHTFSMGLVINNNTMCSGTLIAPNLILTARHCIADSPQTIDCTTSTFGPNVSASAVKASPCADVLSPSCVEWYNVRQITTPSETKFCGQDIALLELTSNVAAIAPAAPLLTPMTNTQVMSAAFTAIGYGKMSFASSTTGLGQRRILSNVSLLCVSGYGDPSYDCNNISNWQYPPEEFFGGAGLCPGDSGSSAFEQRSFSLAQPLSVGVASRAGRDAQDNCVYSIYTRTDSHAALIRSAASRAATAGGYAPLPWVSAPPAGPPDAGPPDTGADARSEASLPSPADAGPETSTQDAGVPDAIAPEASAPDAQTPPDSGAPPPDAGAPEASVKDASDVPDVALPPPSNPPPDASPVVDAGTPPGSVSSPDKSQLVKPEPGSAGGCQTGTGSDVQHAAWLLVAVVLRRKRNQT